MNSKFVQSKNPLFTQLLLAISLSGDYDMPTKECRWVQTYLFGTTTFYRGFYENKRIWGIWKTTDELHGGFEIRPAKKTAPVVPTSSGH